MANSSRSAQNLRIGFECRITKLSVVLLHSENDFLSYKSEPILDMTGVVEYCQNLALPELRSQCPVSCDGRGTRCAAKLVLQIATKLTPFSSESVGIQEQRSGRLEEGLSVTQFNLWKSSQSIESDHGEDDAFNLKGLGNSTSPPLVEALPVLLDMTAVVDLRSLADRQEKKTALPESYGAVGRRANTMKIRGAECTDATRKAPRYLEPRPKTCPPGCPKQKVLHMIPERPYRDFHATPPPGGCLDCTRNETKKPSYHKPRPCPPGTKPIPPKPLGGHPDQYCTETFLDTFDCQEQPWRSSSQRVPTHHEYGYQEIFRPSVSQGKMTCDSLGDFANCDPCKPEWRSSKTYIPCARDYGKSWQWRSRVRYLGEKNCKERDWRSSVHNSTHLDRDEEKPYRSQISTKGGAYTADTETTEGPFRPTLRYIPEFHPNRRDWRPSRAHVCTKKCYHNSRKFEHVYNSVPAFETEQKLPPKDLRRQNPLFFKEHPIKSQPHDITALDDFMLHANEEGQLMPLSGKKPISWTTRSNPTYADGKDKSRRRIISSGHIDHFDSSCFCVCKKKDSYRPTIRIIDGPQHHSVAQRNIVAGPLEPGNEKLPRFRVVGPKPMAPQGTFNEHIIAGRFHDCKSPKEPLTEQRAQYTTCKPWLRQELFNEVNQAYKENRCHDSVVHPAVTRYLYEDRNAVVS